MAEALDLLDEDVLRHLPERDHPGWVDPMKAVLTDAAFSDDDWIYERKARNSDIAVYAYVFDILHLDGRDLRKVPLRDRVGFGDVVRERAHASA